MIEVKSKRSFFDSSKLLLAVIISSLLFSTMLIELIIVFFVKVAFVVVSSTICMACCEDLPTLIDVDESWFAIAAFSFEEDFTSATSVRVFVIKLLI